MKLTAPVTIPPLSTDYWPNALFDPREGNPRDYCPDGTTGGACSLADGDATAGPTLGGTIYYVELDVNNLARWFTGVIGTSGTSAKDPNTAPNDFTVYFSDRRGNYYNGAAFASGWPPLSPSLNETGEYGWNDTINDASQYGCPNGTAGSAPGPGEDFDGTGIQYTYGAQAGQYPFPTAPGVGYAAGNLYNAANAFGVFNTAILSNWKCGNPAYITTGVKVWPWWYVVNPMEARENPPLFFRRALKLVNGSTINLGVCPNLVNCGLTIATENPMYIQGDYNAPGGAFGSSCVGAAAVLADSFTFLSDSWNDVNSFLSTYDTNKRSVAVNGVTQTTYRVAIAAGKGVSFTQPVGYATYQDFGTDGGAHNFLRYIENWGGATLNYRGSIVSLYYNRQGSGDYKCCTTVYSPPSRGYNFDTDFLTPACLPPHTPMFRTVNTIGFTEYVLPQ